MNLSPLIFDFFRFGNLEYLLILHKFSASKICLVNSKSILHWDIATYQYCYSFMWTAKIFSIDNPCIHSPQNMPSIQCGTKLWVELHELYDSFPVVIHSNHSGVYRTSLKAQPFLPHHPPPQTHTQTMSSFSKSWAFLFLQVSSFMIKMKG